MNTHSLLKGIYYKAIEAVSPYKCVANGCARIRTIFESGSYEGLYVFAIGKSAVPMTRAILDTLPYLVSEGVAITKYDHSATFKNRKITLFEAGHPVPDASGLSGTSFLIEKAQGTSQKALIVFLISGGGSALFVKPRTGIELADKQFVTESLLKSGATINELNAVRKHLSAVKGGRLAELLYPRRVVSLVVSDVIGNPLDVIASGPLAPDASTYDDALYVLDRYSLIEKVPENVIKHLKDGLRGHAKETPKPGGRVFDNIENVIVGSNAMALEGAARAACGTGLTARIVTDSLQGEARYAAKWLFSEACNASGPVLLISGGETTVTVKGRGIGGRNMELALAFAIEARGRKHMTLLCAGSDGNDGPTDAAGAIVDGDTFDTATWHGLNPVEFLDNNDSYNFFKRTYGMFVTGPTMVNIMDLQLIYIA